MDSPAPTPRSSVSYRPSWWLPFAAVVQEDLGSALRGWAVAAWVILAAGSCAVAVALSPAPEPADPAAAIAQGQPGKEATFVPPELPARSPIDGAAIGDGRTETRKPDLYQPPAVDPRPRPGAAPKAKPRAVPAVSLSMVGGKLLAWQLVAWSALVLALGAAGVAGEASFAAESILCRGVARWQYFVAKLLSRGTVAVGVFLAVNLGLLAAGMARYPNDVVASGLTEAMVAQGCMALGLALIGVSVGATFRHPLLAVVVAWALLAGIGCTLALVAAPAASPLLVAERFPAVLRGEAADAGKLLAQGVLALGGLSAMVTLWTYNQADL